MQTNTQILEELCAIAVNAGKHNLGDAIVQGIEMRRRIADSVLRQLAEIPMAQLRRLAARAEFGWELLASPPTPPRPLEHMQVLQLVHIEAGLHELCYAFETLEATANVTWGTSTPTRFYLNSIYHCISSMFLVDTSSPRQRNLPMGGTVIRALYPMGLAQLLDSIKAVVGQPFGKDTSFGEAILRFRHSYLVHGTFSPRDVEYLVVQTQMRDTTQQERFASMAWDLFHKAVLLRLRIIALLTASNISVEAVLLRYLVPVLGANPNTNSD